MNEVEKKIEEYEKFLLETSPSIDEQLWRVKSLLQEERQGAVEGFIKWFNGIPNNQMIVFDETYRMYLKSLEDKDKEGK